MQLQVVKNSVCKEVRGVKHKSGAKLKSEGKTSLLYKRLKEYLKEALEPIRAKNQHNLKASEQNLRVVVESE